MRSKLVLAAAIGVTPIAGGIAFAEMPGAPRLAAAHGRDGPRHMLRMSRPARPILRDADGDRADSAKASARYDQADANKDGTVSFEERLEARGLTRPDVTRD